MTFGNTAEPDQGMTADDAAAWWFARLRSNLSSAERERFEAWRKASAQNAEAFDRIQGIWDEMAKAVALPEVRALRTAALSAVPTRSRFRYAAIAAAVAVFVAGGLYLSRPQVNTAFKPAAPTASIAELRDDHATATGERSVFTLRDGSTVTLDTNSAVRVAYSQSQRTIILLRGQAVFEVAKHKPAPFVVRVNDRRVVATGTTFNVRLQSDAIAVTLIEGHVVVERPAPSGLAARRTELQAGQQLIARADAADRVSPVDVAQLMGWRSGRLSFKNQTLKDAADELNRYSSTHVIVKDAALATLRITGVFRTGQPQAFAEGLAAIYPVALSRDRSGDILVTTRANPSPSRN